MGCDVDNKASTTTGFNSDQWTEVRFDIDPDVKPDIVSTMLKMDGVPTASMDAIFSSHNIEHPYPHQAPVALAEFTRVLKPNGFLVITCPDLQAMCQLVAEDKLLETAYLSPAGPVAPVAPVAPVDILYGLRTSMAAGNLFTAHCCGFTQKVFIGSIYHAGFAKVGASPRGSPYFDLWAVAAVDDQPAAQLQAVAAVHIPRCDSGHRGLHLATLAPGSAVHPGVARITFYSR